MLMSVIVWSLHGRKQENLEKTRNPDRPADDMTISHTNTDY